MRAQVRTQFRKIFTQMGFSEMPTNNYVESSFWNFDALFQPQQHPARDAHDTFFLTKVFHFFYYGLSSHVIIDIMYGLLPAWVQHGRSTCCAWARGINVHDVVEECCNVL